MLSRIAKTVCLISLSLCLFSASAKETLINQEFRILIDASGSMKKNDPDNLRANALRLILKIIPANTRSGIWLFSDKTSELVPLKVVDQKWKDMAHLASYKVHSKGLLSNIEVALSTVTRDLERSSPDHKIHIILLSDGVIDVGNDLMKDVESRDFILQEILPKLKSKKVIINTIALSKDADIVLLKKLSSETGGTFQLINAPEQLSKAFFKIFEPYLYKEDIPVNDKVFTVDKTVAEITVLIFKNKESSEAIVLESPDKKSYSLDHRPYNIQWHDETNYTLVTISKPQVGQWKLSGPVDPNNRVMVMSNIRVTASKLPKIIFKNEVLDHTITLLAHEKILSNPEFLSKMKVFINSQAQNKDLIKESSGWTKQGIKKNKLWMKLPKGEHRINSILMSDTFHRAIPQSIDVNSIPVTIVEKKPEYSSDPYTVIFDPKIDVMQADSLKIQTQVLNSQNKQFGIKLIRNKNNRWVMTVPPFSKNKKRKVIYTINGETLSGRKFTIITDPQIFLGHHVVIKKSKKTGELSKSVLVMKTAIYHKNTEKIKEKNIMEIVSLGQWMLGAGMFLLFGATWGGTSFMVKKMASKKLEKMKEILS